MDNQELIALVKSGQCTFAADRGGTCYKAEGLGVRPIITPMRDNLAFFHGCPVADTISARPRPCCSFSPALPLSMAQL